MAAALAAASWGTASASPVAAAGTRTAVATPSGVIHVLRVERRRGANAPALLPCFVVVTEPFLDTRLALTPILL